MNWGSSRKNWPKMKNEKIWKDGRLIGWDECKIHALSYSLHYGVAAFEGIRFYDTPRGIGLFRLRDHIKRLLNSAREFCMKVKYSNEELVDATKRIVRESKKQTGYVRAIIFYGSTKLLVHDEDNEVNIVIALLPWGKYLKHDSIKIMSSSYMRQHPKSVPMNAKIAGYYVNSVLAVREARKKGYDEALMLDFKGNVAEGSAENFFIVKEKRLATPPLGNILPGITRDSVIEIARDNGMKIEERKFSLDYAKNADEAFVTGTGAEITPVIQIDKKIIGDGNVGPATKKLMKLYQDAVSGKIKKYEKWLDYA